MVNDDSSLHGKTTDSPTGWVADAGTAATAIRVFFRIVDTWKLTRAQSAILLSASDRSVNRWKNAAGSAELSRDQMERLSYILGIYGRLHAILAESVLADDWIRRPNADFGNAPPLDRMLTGNIDDLVDIRRYVDAWRVGW